MSTLKFPSENLNLIRAFIPKGRRIRDSGLETISAKHLASIKEGFKKLEIMDVTDSASMIEATDKLSQFEEMKNILPNHIYKGRAQKDLFRIIIE